MQKPRTCLVYVFENTENNTILVFSKKLFLVSEFSVFQNQIIIIIIIIMETKRILCVFLVLLVFT